MVERSLGKTEVSGPIPDEGSEVENKNEKPPGKGRLFFERC